MIIVLHNLFLPSLVSTYYVPDTIIGAGDIKMNKTVATLS